MKSASGSGTFYYDSAYWTDSATYNDGNPSVADAEAEYVSFFGVSGSVVRACQGASANCVQYGIRSSMTALSLFSGSTGTDGPNRASMTAVFGDNTGVGQPNCNQSGINVNGGYSRARFGIRFNNEADCDTTDGVSGFGIVTSSGATYYTACGAGANYWATPSCAFHTLWIR